MKSFLLIVLFYVCVALMMAGCSEGNDPAPSCRTAEVVGPYNCPSGAYVLRLLDSAGGSSNGFIGQLQGGFVTTRSLPEAYRQPGLRLNLTLEVDEAPTQVCTAVHVLYPTVRVVRVCDVAGTQD